MIVSKYFTGIHSLDELKAEFRKLVLKNHPDRGGNEEVMKAINNEYDQLFPVYKLMYNRTASSPTHETADSDRSKFYTEHGWEGKNYRVEMSVTDIGAAIRAYVKKAYPQCKFAVHKISYSHIEIILVSGPEKATVLGSNHCQVNQYRINDDDELTPWARAIFNDVNDVIRSYLHDDSDPMYDYYDCNFYYTLSVGTYTKPYEIVVGRKQSKRTAKHSESSDVAVQYA